MNNKTTSAAASSECKREKGCPISYAIADKAAIHYGLIDDIVEAPRLSGTQKTREYFWGFLRDVRRCLLDHFEIRTA